MVGKSLSHYKILEELGRGGMGIVYKAEDTKLDRTVAIKVLPAAALSSEDDRARFYREAKAAAQLHHPHIASVFEIDEAVPEGSKDDDLRPFISMEYIEGETLSDRIKKGPLKLEEAVKIASQIASGLEAAHEKNIVHRDIKSGNVMLTKKGISKILDFGLAQTAASTKLTRQGSTVGTIGYMSPEQARGEEVDHRTDLWSLGVILYEMISGQAPFPGDYEQAVVYEILNQDPEPLTGIRTGIPLQIEWVVNKLLAKDRSHRYQSASELIVDLKTIDLSVDDHWSGRVAASDEDMLTAEIKRSPNRYWILAGIVMALLTGVAIGTVLTSEKSDSHQTIRFPIQLDGATSPLSASWTPDGRSIYYVALDTISQKTIVRSYHLATGITQTVEGTDDAVSVLISPNGRWLIFGNSRANYYERVLLEGGESSEIVTPAIGNPSFTGSMSPDGDLYFSTDGWDIAAVSEDSRQRILASNDTLSFRFFAQPIVSPDGKRLFWRSGITPSVTDGTWAILEPDTEPVHVLPDYSLAAITSNGYALVWPRTSTRGTLSVVPFDISTGLTKGVPIPFDRVASLALSENGNLVYQTSLRPDEEAGTESIEHLESDGSTTLIARLNGVSRNIASAHNRNSVIIESREIRGEQQNLYLIDIESGTQTRLTRDGDNRNPILSLDDQYVYFDRETSSGQRFIARRLSYGSGQIETVIEDSVAVSNPALASDGNLLIYSKLNAVTRWDLYGYRMDTGEHFVISDAGGAQTDAHISPDDKYVVYWSGESDGALIVQPIGGGGDIEVAQGGSHPVWSSDGRYIYFNSADFSELYRIPVTTNPNFRITGNTEFVYQNPNHPHFDVLTDGTVILLHHESSTVQTGKIWVIINFDDEMERIAPPTD